MYFRTFFVLFISFCFTCLSSRIYGQSDAFLGQRHTISSNDTSAGEESEDTSYPGNKKASANWALTYDFIFKSGLGNAYVSNAQGGQGKTDGVFMGGLVSFNLRNLSIQPGIFDNIKGYRVNTGNGSYIDYNSGYFEFPLDIIYHIPLTKVFHGRYILGAYLGAGPYFGKASGGQVYTSGTAPPGVIYSYNIDWGTYRKTKYGNDSTDDFRSIDYGYNFLAGFQIRSKNAGFALEVNYDLGAANISPNGSPYPIQENRSIEFTFGLIFKLGKWKR